MAKRTRSKTTAKAAKRTKAAPKTRRKTAPPIQLKPAAPHKAKKPTTKVKTAAPKAASPPESLTHRIAGAIRAVVDTLSDAEQLHHKLEPDPTKTLDLE